MTPPRRVIHHLLQRPLRMRIRLRGAAEPHAGTDIIPPLPTPLAFFARLAHLQRDLISYLPLIRGHRGSDSHDDAGGFVAEGQGFADEDVAVAEVSVVVEVRAAEAGCVDCDLQVRGGGAGEGAWLYAEVFCAVED